MNTLIGNLIKSFGGSMHETGGMIAGVFYDDDLAERCADEIAFLCGNVTVNVDGDCVLIWE
jgi:cystathionine beta-lyase family protein involved in aluminum resistance